MGGTFRFTQHIPRILVSDRRERVFVPNPAAIRNALTEFRSGVTFLRFEQEEMTVFVDQPSTKPKEPIDDRKLLVHDEIVESRLLSNLAPSGLFGCFVTIEVALGKPPVLVAVEDDEKGGALRRTSNYHTAGGSLELRLQNTENLKYFLGFA